MPMIPRATGQVRRTTPLGSERVCSTAAWAALSIADFIRHDQEGQMHDPHTGEGGN